MQPNFASKAAFQLMTEKKSDMADFAFDVLDFDASLCRGQGSCGLDAEHWSGIGGGVH